MRRLAVWLAVSLMPFPFVAHAATPPAQINYQGVLRDASDKPLTGTYDMVFSFWDAATGGNDILDDSHLGSGSGGVSVSNGLFNAALGGGTVADGPGPGTYTGLDQIFRDYGAVWLQVKIGSETLSPRTQIVAAAYALNASNFGGRPPNGYVDTSSTAQTKTGGLTLDTSASSALALSVQAQLQGAIVSSNNSYVYLANNDQGVKASGSSYGGVFQNGSSGAYAYLGTSGNGVEGYSGGFGNGVFGYNTANGGAGVFGQTLNPSAYGVWGYGPVGLYGVGYSGGAGGGLGLSAVGQYPSGGASVYDGAYTGSARLGIGDTGIVAKGNFQGGEFSQNGASTVLSRLAYNGAAVTGYSNTDGLYHANEKPSFFQDYYYNNYAQVGYQNYKIQGNGTVAFVQNDPTEAGLQVVYAAPEGDEVSVYTRGSAKLVDGAARVALGDTFRRVANPDIGLTATLTPHGEPAPLAIEALSSAELVVRGPAGSSATFDYLVWGLRIGFEDHAVVQPRERDWPIPNPAKDAAILSSHPELKAFTASSRYAAMRQAIDPAAPAAPDLSRSEALKASIGVGGPSRNGVLPDPLRLTVEDPAKLPNAAPAAQAPFPLAPTSPASPRGVPPAADASAGAGIPSAAPPAVLQHGVARVRVADDVRPGDVVVADPADSETLHLASKVADPLVVGVVVAPDDAAPVEPGEALVVAAGTIVPCHVDASYGAIRAGDLLTTSPTPGRAMRAADPTPGTILGKALQDFDRGAGTIRILVMSR